MKEYFEKGLNDDIRLNIKVNRKVWKSNDQQQKSESNQDISKNANKIDAVKVIKRQRLSIDDIDISKLPIQKLLPIPFLECIESFSLIERGESLVFIDFRMQKKWLGYLIQKIQDATNIEDQSKSKNALRNDKLEVDIIEMENATTFRIYTNHQTFRMIFSDKFNNVMLICGLHILRANHDVIDEKISQEKIKKGIVKRIVGKWIN
jgi:hypothetical protein